MNCIKSPEQRLHFRRPYRTEVVFEDEFGDGLFYVYSKDLSLGGLRLVSDIPVRVRTLLFLSFKLPSHKRSIRVTGEVVRCVVGDEPVGIGVRFLGLTELAYKRIENFTKTQTDL